LQGETNWEYPGVAYAGDATVSKAKDIVSSIRPYLKRVKLANISRCIITGIFVNWQVSLTGVAPRA
jgi:hypothetical protein